MEQVKNSFRNDYNLAVRSFNEKDFKSFFRNIRPAIELLGKFCIYDILGESDAKDLLDGTTSIEWDRNSMLWKIIEYPASHNPTGRDFCELAYRAYFSQNTDITTQKYDEKKKRLKRGMESCGSALARYYSIASEYIHPGSTNMTLEVQAASCAFFLMGYFDFLKSNKVLSTSSISFLDSLSIFRSDDPSALEESKQKIEGLIKEVEDKETALLFAQKMQAEAEQQRLVAEQRTAEVESQLAILQSQIADMQKQLKDKETLELAVDKSVSSAPNAGLQDSIVDDSLHFKEIMRGIVKGIDIEEDSMDDDQLDLIEYTNDKSMLVAGCAGSGKSVIAMHKAMQLQKAGKDVILIAYTLSLKDFMRIGVESNSYRFLHYHQWKKQGMPPADYIIVDEIQDFTHDEIMEFIQAAKKCFLFFGDTAQSIYRHYGRATMSIDEISEMTGLDVLQLYNNYRLPRPVAKITQDYVGVDVPEYKEKVYQNRESELPHIVRVENDSQEFECICDIIKANSDKSIGILYHNNESVLQLYQQMLDYGVNCEFKYNRQENDGTIRTKGNLNFYSTLPKIMTYHSAKGLQFDVVILPQFTDATDVDTRKSVYVAMTRTMKKLYVLYQGVGCPSPLNAVPAHLYSKTL